MVDSPPGNVRTSELPTCPCAPDIFLLILTEHLSVLEGNLHADPSKTASSFHIFSYYLYSLKSFGRMEIGESENSYRISRGFNR